MISNYRTFVGDLSGLGEMCALAQSFAPQNNVSSPLASNFPGQSQAPAQQLASSIVEVLSAALPDTSSGANGANATGAKLRHTINTIQSLARGSAGESSNGRPTGANASDVMPVDVSNDPFVRRLREDLDTIQGTVRDHSRELVAHGQ